MRFHTTETRPIVYTLTANCRDCYRCIRVCPVKAIRVQGDQAFVDDDRCIHCGTCVRECPQRAKTIRSDTERVRELLEGGRPVAVSVAPSFAAQYDGWKSTRFPSLLRRLGFRYIAETAEGAVAVAQETGRLLREEPDRTGCIGSACPAVVRYVEKYRPELVPHLLPVVSPMIAHARMLKERLGDSWHVVFIGPCAAKKMEAEREEYAGDVDAVLTFEELDRWIRDEGLDPATCPDGGFDHPDPLGAHRKLRDARMFALAGGMLKTAKIPNDGVQPDVLHLSGSDSVASLMDIPAEEWAYRLVEPLFCAEGCINGPGLAPDKNVYQRKNDLIRYAGRREEPAGTGPDEEEPMPGPEALAARFRDDDAVPVPDVPEARIREVFEQTGKAQPELQLNCGACGYRSCRDNAIAVATDMAEPEMCIPYMRRLAEQRTDRIIETSPNGIVIVDADLRIRRINPAFEALFLCSSAVLGRPVSYLLDASGFEAMADGTEERHESILDQYGRRFHQILYPLPDTGQYVGIYMDLSDLPVSPGGSDLVRRETVRQARELLQHQIRMSQEMAGMLGRSTAKGEELVLKLMSLYGETDDVEETI